MILPLLLLSLAIPAPDPHLYPTVPLATVAAGRWTRPRACVTGTVAMVKKETDGDWHVRLEEDGRFIVCEFCPEFPVAPPRKGQHVRIWGIVRQDKHHGDWWELHVAWGWLPAPLNH